MSNIVLVGFMGVGKTSVAAELSELLGWEVVDIDDVIESDAGISISRIFTEFGEEHFRDLESAAVVKIAEQRNLIISTGGGVVLRPTNMDQLKSTGQVFCLTATSEEIWRRVGHETHRPLLDTPDPMTRIREMLEARASAYSQADHMVDTVGKSPCAVAEEIVQIHQQTEQES